MKGESGLKTKLLSGIPGLLTLEDFNRVQGCLALATFPLKTHHGETIVFKYLEWWLVPEKPARMRPSNPLPPIILHHARQSHVPTNHPARDILANVAQ